MSQGKTIKYYGVEGQERLDLDPNDTLDYQLSCMTKEEIKGIMYPFEILVFTPQKISLNGDEILNNILENLDENYGDPDGDISSTTDRMKDAATLLSDIIKEDYTSFMCEETGDKIEYFEKDILEIVGLEL